MIRLSPVTGQRVFKREDKLIIANGGHEGIAAEDWIDRNQLKAEAAEMFDISQPAVCKALKNITESPQCGKEVIVPAHIAANKNSKTDFLKLSTTGQKRVRHREPLNRVATYPESLGDFFQQL